MTKLTIKYFGFPNEDTCDLDQAQYLFGIKDIMVMVDGLRISSYDELVQLVAREKYKDKKQIDVVLLPTIAGG